MSENPFKRQQNQDRHLINKLAARVRNLERRITSPASPAGAEYATLSWAGSLSVAGSGGTSVIPWTEFDTTNTDVFGTVTGSGSTPHNATGDTGLLLRGAGAYIVMAAAEWESGAAKIASSINIARGDNMNQIDFKAIELLAATTFSGHAQFLNPASYVMTSANGVVTGLVNLNLANLDTGAWNCVSALMGCIFWPVTNDLTTIYG